MTNFDLDGLVLRKGSHASYEDGMCLMEAVAFFAGESHGDQPQCVSPVITAFLRSWNDSVDDGFRQKLKIFVPLVIGTVNDGNDETRVWMCTDWLVRFCAPAWLDLANLTQHAMALRTADEIRDADGARKVQDRLNAAWAAARAATRAAAWIAARDTAGDAAWDTARAAQRAATRAAAWDAAWAAAGAAAWIAARDTAMDTAMDAAMDAAWDAVGDARDARAALAPTVAMLQASALDLVERMVSLPGMETR